MFTKISKRDFAFSLALLVLVSQATFLIVVHFLIEKYGFNPPLDFSVFWSAGRLAVSGHPALAYDHHALVLSEHIAPEAYLYGYDWRYPPSFLLLLAPLGAMPYLAAFALFSVIGATAGHPQ